ncbi:MAG: hypothetical protein BGO41_04490 [Clostridiales bacterium 38-18]|nr:MAG: hypothetical protein BGO41_04490 [Clostridiales bacterium 38-18]
MIENRTEDYREQLISLLNAYTPYEASDELSKQKTLDFIASNDVIYGTLNPHGHITASSWLINFIGDSVLMTHHKKLDLWLQLGGHTELNESIQQSAMRETIEESGLKALDFVDAEIFDIDVHEIPLRKNQASHYHYDIRFLIRQTTEEGFTISDESNALKWVKLTEVNRLTNQRSVIRMVEKYLYLNER